MKAGIDVVIVSYRCREYLRECLRSLEVHENGVAVHVVDNDSRDGTVEMLQAEFPAVKLVAANRNLGFATAVNLAVKQADREYVLLLNPDARLIEPTLEGLVDLMEASPEIGVCGCRLERADGSFDHAARRSFPTPISALGHFTGLGRREGANGRLAAYRAPSVVKGPVDAVNGAFMLIRRSALAQVGLLDEGYWMYMEDLDLCYRFASAGWTTWYEPSVTVKHQKGGSTPLPRTPRLNWAFHYGMYRFYRKHYASENRRLLNALVYVGIGGKLALCLLRSAFRRTVTLPART